MLNTKERYPAIDYLKFLAVILVMNSHLNDYYTKYQMLATGGAMGDALFFFASGFTLLLGRRMSFDNWYKRRINRIYPSILAAAIFAFLIFRFREDFIDVLIGKRYWFISCILLYYVLIYPIKYFGEGKYLKHVFIGWSIICIIVYFTIFGANVTYYGDWTFRIFVFFLFMLQGAYMGIHQKDYHYKKLYPIYWILSIIAWVILSKIGTGKWYHITSVIPLLLFSRYSYLIFTSDKFTNFYRTKIGGNIIYIISQLCLEVYLIQKFAFTDKINFLFPLNIPINMVLALIAAYMVKLLANLIQQTFRTEPYDWKNMLLYKKKDMIIVPTSSTK